MRYPRVFEKTAVSGSTYRLTFQDEKSCGVLTTAGGAIHTTCIGIADLHRDCWRELTDHHAEPAAGDEHDNDPADEAFVRELLGVHNIREHGLFRFRFGEIEWRKHESRNFWIDLHGIGSKSPSDFTRRQLRRLVSALKGE